MKNLNELKAATAEAKAAYEAKQADLIASGLKSKERYILLKDLKVSLDAAHSEMYKTSVKEICAELDKIIAKQTPAQRAEGLRRARNV